MEETEMMFYESKGKLLLLMIGCLLFVGAGFYFSYTLFMEGSLLFSFIMLLCGGFFLFILLMYVRKIGSGHPHVIVTAEFLQLYVLPTEKINIRWEDIEAYIPYRMHSNSFIGLVLKEEERYAKLMPKRMKKLSRMNVKMGYPQYNIVLSHLKQKKLLMEELEKRIVETNANEESFRTNNALK